MISLFKRTCSSHVSVIISNEDYQKVSIKQIYIHVHLITGKGHNCTNTVTDVQYDLFHDVCHVAYISGHQKVGGSNAPDAELSAILSIGLARTMLHHATIHTTLQKMPTLVNEMLAC